MSWWKLISPIFYECLIVKRYKQGKQEIKKKTRALNNPKYTKPLNYRYDIHAWDIHFSHLESTNSDKSSTYSPIQIDAFSYTEDESTIYFRYNPRFSQLMRRDCSTGISFKRIIPPPFFYSLVPKELSLELPYRVSLLRFCKRFQQKKRGVRDQILCWKIHRTDIFVNFRYISYLCIRHWNTNVHFIEEISFQHMHIYRLINFFNLLMHHKNVLKSSVTGITAKKFIEEREIPFIGHFLKCVFCFLFI